MLQGTRAWASGNGGLAKVLSRQGKDHAQKMKVEEAKAREAIFRQRNAPRKHLQNVYAKITRPTNKQTLQALARRLYTEESPASLHSLVIACNGFSLDCLWQCATQVI